MTPRFIGPFDIIAKIGDVAYRLALPPSISHVHDVFHVSMLRNYHPDLSHVLDWSHIELELEAYPYSRFEGASIARKDHSSFEDFVKQSQI